MQRLDHVVDDPTVWFTLGEEAEAPLDGLDVILMRKDPPFDMEYIYSTYLLELADKRPSSSIGPRRCGMPMKRPSPPPFRSAPHQH